MNQLQGIISKLAEQTNDLVREYKQAEAEDAPKIQSIFKKATTFLADLEVAKSSYSEYLEQDRDGSLKTLNDSIVKINNVIKYIADLSPQGLAQQEAFIIPLLDLTTITDINELKTELKIHLNKIKDILNKPNLTTENLEQIKSSLRTTTQDTASLFNRFEYVKDRDIELALIDFDFLELTDLTKEKEKTFDLIKSPSINQSIKKKSKDSYKNYIIPFALLVFFGSYLANNNFLFFAFIASALVQLTLRTNTPSKELSLPKWQPLREENLNFEDIQAAFSTYLTECKTILENPDLTDETLNDIERAVKAATTDATNSITNEDHIVLLMSSSEEVLDLIKRKRTERLEIQSLNLTDVTTPLLGKKETGLNSLRAGRNRLGESYNEHLDKNVGELETSYDISAFRQIKGDGNCYYRAALFGLLEQVIQKTPEERKKRLFEIKEEFKKLPNPSKSHILLISALEEASEGRIWKTPEELETSFLDADFDFAAVRSCRDLLASWIRKNTKTEFNGISLETTIAAEKNQSIEDYIAEYVNPMGTCAEGAPIYIGALGLILNFKLTIYILPKEENTRVSVTENEASSQIAEQVHLLLRPGHYDVIYKRP